MAEKEERILITTRHKDEETNMTFTDMYKEYTHAEAIEKMAKAMCKKDFGDCGKCMCRNEEECYTVVEDSKWFGLAEAALNALLGE